MNFAWTLLKQPYTSPVRLDKGALPLRVTNFDFLDPVTTPPIQVT